MFIAIWSLIALLGFCGLMAAALIVLLRRRTALRLEARFAAHECHPESVQVVITFDRLCDDGRGGHLIVWRGMYCDSCFKRLVCSACGKVPALGEVIGVRQMFDGTNWRCCKQPEYVLADPETPEEWKQLN